MSGFLSGEKADQFRKAITDSGFRIASDITVEIANDTGNPLPVSNAAAAVTSGTLQTAAATTGNGSTFSVSGQATVQLTISGTYTGLTIVIEGTEDGTNYSTINVVQLGTNTISSSVSANGVYQAAVAGLITIRARISAISTGSVTVTAHAVPLTFTARAIDAHLADKLDLVNDSITSYEGGWNMTTITSATTTVVAAFPCYVKRVKTIGFAVAGNITVYDNTAASGTNPVPAVQ